MSHRYFKPVLLKSHKELSYENNVHKLRFHDLRHTYASYLLSNGVPIKYVQEQLGHASASITLDTYNHVMPSVKKEAFSAWKNIAC